MGVLLVATAVRDQLLGDLRQQSLVFRQLDGRHLLAHLADLSFDLLALRDFAADGANMLFQLFVFANQIIDLTIARSGFVVIFQ